MLGQTPLPELGPAIVELAVPKGMTARDAAKAVAAQEPDATVDVVHYYGLEPAGGKPRPLRDPTAAPTHGDTPTRPSR